ncbi:tripartite ATP-independent transporter DctM subunit [Mesorhizobium sp. J18]|uniref:TRAP transporter large permease n=1 Tax=Mesorhizobium sp. J18 TaxID=935263 RepID=UPI00119BDDE0|nr:TRAP transporter large permease subunit [Mesorhizobium sp. J18]TWG93501.1 tripartite ATP-independent transporter DctM subunit [Mesorhizobium sp. J18]
MTGIEIGLAGIGLLLLLILLGMPIGVAMMVSSFGAVAYLRNETVALRMLGSVANDSLEEYLFAIVPLFVMMGLLVTISGVGKDTFDLFERLLRRVRAGLGIATVFANAVFASITGISVASASVFSRIAVPEMVRHGYTTKFSTGVVAGSSVLGMLIPPSLLMVVYAVLAEESVGRMFLSGVGPGILLSTLFALTIMLMAWRRPGSVFEREAKIVSGETNGLLDVIRKGAPIVMLVTVVLGGLYAGFLNPTEAGAMGALGALLIALVRRSLTLSSFRSLLVETGQITVSVLFLIVAATFFSRMLAMSGLPMALAEFLIGGTLGPWGFMTVFIALVILMGCFIDSISIMLILLPIALPVARAAGFDMIWFGVMTVVAVEIGLLSPPFGLSVYTIKSAINDPKLKVGDIFRGSFPFVIAMVICLVVLAIFPQIATWLARL